MLKKISVEHLKPGMYVANITQKDVSLHQHEKEGRVKDETTIQALLKRGVKELYIDTAQGEDSEDAIPLEESEAALDSQLESVVQQKSSLDNPKHASFEQEFEKASKMHSEALGLVSQALASAKSGENIDIAPFEDMADNFMGSVVRNQNALACLSRIRDKDSYLMEHSVNVAVLMAILGKYLNLERTYLHHCVTGALLHDIGKILIPDTILHKPGKLTNEEFAIMKRHALYSQKILEKNHGFPQTAINVAGQHHERLDGNGYPAGLTGEEVSQEGRMASVVDVYDAITADRVYHKGMTPSTALKRMLEWSGPHLDAKYVQAFIKAMGIYPVGSLVELESGMAAIVIEENDDSLKPTVKVIYNLKTAMFAPITKVNLSKSGTNDRIVRPIDPEDHGIKVRDFLQ